MTSTNLRKLKAKDARVLATLIGRHLPLLATVQGDRDSDDYRREVGMKLVGLILDKELDTLWGWIADVNQMTVEQLDDSPPETPFEVLKELQEGDQFKGFLQLLKSLAPEKADTEEPSTP